VPQVYRYKIRHNLCHRNIGIGSGTTGAVAHKLKRKWIMIEMLDHCKTHIIPRLIRIIDNQESKYLISLHRGLYFKENMLKGQIVRLEDVYPALPLKENNHISSRTFVNDNYTLRKDVIKNMPLLKEDIK